MIIRKGFTFQLKTDRRIEQQLRRTAGCTRWVWNCALAVQRERLERGEPVESYAVMCKSLTGWKMDAASAFLQEVHSQPLQQKLKDLRRAFDDFFAVKRTGKMFPRFKKKGSDTDSFRYPQGVKLQGRRIWLPKIGWVRYYKSREVEGEIKNVTVRRRGDRWYVSVQTEYEVPDPVHPSASVIGADLGIARFVTLSDGTYVRTLNSLRCSAEKLSKAQRKLARQEKGSAHWKRQQKRIARLHIRIADTRRDFLHKTSTTISKNHAVVVLEDLSVKRMSGSAKGTVKTPGRNVRQKSGLNKAILDQGWGMFGRQLEYKLAWQGGYLVLVPPQKTSQTCSVCGSVARESRRSQDRFGCVACGYEEHADVNAAKNILAAGHAVMACGSSHRGSIEPGRKQEPLVGLG